MALSGVGATPEPSKNLPTQQPQKDNTNKSIFSKYDSNQDGKVDANEQRVALTYFVNNLYKNLKQNMNMQAINLIKKFSNSFKTIVSNGTVKNANEINTQIEEMLNKQGNNIVKLLSEGNDRTKDFKSHKEFMNAKDLKIGDYCISEKGYIYQFNGEGKQWSVYGGDFK